MVIGFGLPAVGEHFTRLTIDLPRNDSLASTKDHGQRTRKKAASRYRGSSIADQTGYTEANFFGHPDRLTFTMKLEGMITLS